eukprot:Clim_evm4s205 gene=Clim_evmTU4s205
MAMSGEVCMGGIIASYLLLYTAYSKSAKTLVMDDLWDVLFVRKSVDHTLVQWNKVISLAGLTGLAFVFTPGFDRICDTASLLTVSSILLQIHAAYSIFKYYGSPNIPEIQTFPKAFNEMNAKSPKERLVAKRKLSIVLGSIGNAMLLLFELGFLTVTQAAGLAVTAVGVTHFYFMEVDFKDKLQVRPWGYLAFFAPAVALIVGPYILAKEAFA